MLDWLNSPGAYQTAALVFGILVIFALAGILGQLVFIASILSEIHARTAIPPERMDIDDWEVQ